ncbi:transposable element Tc1 transposase [Trichonephila clavipes]|nr:transposable element Tc1 transposase [Trichonephila clavipes]
MIYNLINKKQLEVLQLTRNIGHASFQAHITSKFKLNSSSLRVTEFERGRIIGLKEGGFGKIGESFGVWVEAIWPLEDAGKNGWKIADFSVMIVAFDLGGQMDCWNQADWRRIVFNDEVRFRLCSEHHGKRVWRRPGQHDDLAFTIARHTSIQLRVMVWGVISFDSRTPLVFISGTLKAHRYVDGILRTVLLPFLLQYPGLIFQLDNAEPHTTRVAMNCLTAYQTLTWPARLSDPSSIEHVWDMMGR